MSSPFDRSGQLSASALARVASEAAGARRHTAGDAYSYVGPQGAVIVPPAPVVQGGSLLQGGVPLARNIDLDGSSGTQILSMALPAAGTFVVAAMVTALLETPGVTGTLDGLAPNISAYLNGNNHGGEATVAAQVVNVQVGGLGVLGTATLLWTGVAAGTTAYLLATSNYVGPTVARILQPEAPSNGGGYWTALFYWGM